MAFHIIKTIHSIEDLVARLAQAREDKAISQAELGERIGTPQGHVSRIERGLVDIRASNLIELARSLDLELMLVPRPYVPAIRALLQDAGDDLGTTGEGPLYQLRKD